MVGGERTFFPILIWSISLCKFDNLVSVLENEETDQLDLKNIIFSPLDKGRLKFLLLAKVGHMKQHIHSPNKILKAIN